jgi:hypothetical protein
MKCLVMCISSKGLKFQLMATPKIKCLFSDVLKREYPFLISDETDANKVRCTLCKSVFSISHGGRNYIQKHIRTNKHKESLAAKAPSKKIDSFLQEKPLMIKNWTLQKMKEHSLSILPLTIKVSNRWTVPRQ